VKSVTISIVVVGIECHI